jgi:hypothetical protein
LPLAMMPATRLHQQRLVMPRQRRKSLRLVGRFRPLSTLSQVPSSPIFLCVPPSAPAVKPQSRNKPERLFPRRLAA